MTHPDLIERITRSLAYMLRHQPEQFDLQLDEYGWADLREVVRALNERLGEAVSLEDVQDAVSSGDRQRYEIDRGMIRALYGHSIDVQPGEPSQPPEFLYVGVSRQDAERAERFGLRPGRRRFLHLALTSEDALETAARSAEDVVLVQVHALEAWEEGISFYDRKALFLSDPIPTNYLEISEIPERSEAPREESYAGAHAAPAESFTEEAPAGGEPSGGAGAPRAFAPRGPGEGGGGRRRGRRGGRGRGRDFSDDRRPPPNDSFQNRPPPSAPARAYDDRPRQGQGGGRDDRPRHGGGGGGGGGGGPRYGGGAPRPAHSGGGQGGPRGGDRGGYRDDRNRGFRDDRPRQDAPRHDGPRHEGPRQDAPRREERGPAPEREGWQRREERPRQAEERRPAPPPPPAPPPRSEPPPPAAPRVEAPKRPAKPARRESSGDGSFGAGL